MKQNRILILTFILLIVTGALYRLVPDRPLGFAPQIAMALFGGAVISNKKWAFAIPLFSMLIGDILFEVLYRAGLVNMSGFYHGQWFNYMLLAAITFIGMGIKKEKVSSILSNAIAAPLGYFLCSNFFVWLSGGGYAHPKTFAGLMMAMQDGVPFLKGSIAATLVFSALFFGVYTLAQRSRGIGLSKATA